MALTKIFIQCCHNNLLFSNILLPHPCFHQDCCFLKLLLTHFFQPLPSCFFLSYFLEVCSSNQESDGQLKSKTNIDNFNHRTTKIQKYEGLVTIRKNRYFQGKQHPSSHILLAKIVLIVISHILLWSFFLNVLEWKGFFRKSRISESGCFKFVTKNYLHNIQQVCLKNLHLFRLQTVQQTPVKIRWLFYKLGVIHFKNNLHLMDLSFFHSMQLLKNSLCPLFSILAWIDPISWVNIMTDQPSKE